MSRRQKAFFDRALKKGKVRPKRFRLNVVGRDRAGKSSFVDALLGNTFDPEKPSTDGISIDVAMTSAETWKKELEEGDFLDKYAAMACLRRDETEEQQEDEETNVTPQNGSTTTLPDKMTSLKAQGEAALVSRAQRQDHKAVDKLDGLEKLTDRQSNLIVKLKNDPKLFRDLYRAIFAHIWDFGGQEIFLTTHSALMPDNPRFALTAYAIVSNLTQKLSGNAGVTIYRPNDGQEEVREALMSLKTNRAFFECWLTSIAIAHDKQEILLGKGFWCQLSAHFSYWNSYWRTESSRSAGEQQ